MAAKAVSRRTPARSKSPAPRATRATRSAKKASPAKSKSPAPRTKRTPRKAKVAEEDDVDTDVETEPVPKPARKTKKTKAAAAAEEAAALHSTKFATLLVMRVVYSCLFAVAAFVAYFPKETTAFVGSTPETQNAALTRLLAVAIFCLCLQHIAAAQGEHQSQRHSLQYGMFTWVMVTALAVHTQSEDNGFKGGPIVVIPSIVMIFLSLWASYYS